MLASRAPATLARSLLIPWAAAAVLGCAWTAVQVHPFDGFGPIVLAGILGIAIIAVPMPRILRIVLGLGFGIALRSVAHESLTVGELHGDAIYNLQLSANVHAGKGLTVAVPGYGENLRAMYPPVYILALAATQGLGGNEVLLNTFSDIVAAAALLRLSKGNERVAIAYFLFPSVVLASIVPLKEELAIAFMLVAMCLVRRPLLFGAVAGLVALTQPAWSPVPLIAFALIERNSRALAAAAVGALVVLVPWWVRNALVLGDFVPLTTSPGFSLWVAVFGTYQASTTVPMGEVALSAETGRAALAAIAADPFAYLARVFGTTPFTLALDSEMASLVGPERAPWVAASANASNAAWASLLAWAAARRAELDKRWLAFAAGWLAGIALGVWFEFSPRHRAFAVPLLLLWIAAQSRRGIRA